MSDPTPSTAVADSKADMYHEEVQHDLKGDVRLETVQNADLFEALNAEKLNPRSRASLTLYFCIFVAFSCQIANGYDGSLFTGILSMKHFQSTFKSGTEGSKVSLIASMYNVGNMVTFPLAAWLSDRYGRRRGMAAGAVIVLVGMVISSAAQHIPEFVVGRFVLGMGITIMNTAAPAYAVELSPPQWRGRLVGIYQIGWFSGNIIAAAVTFGTNNIDNDFSWRIPVILQAVACLWVIGCTFFIPESPRFLFLQGRETEAKEFLVRFHGSGNPESKLAALEFAEFHEALDLNGADKRWWDYRPLFATHSGRWRILQVIMIAIAGQFSGNGLAYFNTVIYSKLGVESVAEQLGYNLLNSVISASGAILAASLSDRMPRRKVLIFGTIACSCWLAINVGLQSKIGSNVEGISKATASGALACYFIFNWVLQFTYTPMQALIPTEAMTSEMRAKGISLFSFGANCMGFINQFAGPIALQNIGYKYVYFFVGWDLVEAAAWYFLGVESHGRTLEEMAWVYEQPNPVKASLSVQKVYVDSEGQVAARVEE